MSLFTPNHFRSFVMGCLFTGAAAFGLGMALAAFDEWADEETYVLRCMDTWQAHEEPCREMYRRYFQ